MQRQSDPLGDVDAAKGFCHRLQWTAATVDAECNRSVFMPGYPLDQGILHPGIPQVIDKRVTKAVERLSGVGYALLGLVPTEPL